MHALKALIYEFGNRLYAAQCFHKLRQGHEFDCRFVHRQLLGYKPLTSHLIGPWFFQVNLEFQYAVGLFLAQILE